MASRNSKRGSSALDPLMAGFAAGAVAFIIYAMPQGRFEDAVALSGLPLIIPAAGAQLGIMARIAAMVVAGIGGFVLVWLVLRALSKPAARSQIKSEPVEIEMAPPRLRRADMHPDAPSRRPILAGVDLGPAFDSLPADHSENLDEDASEEKEVRPEGEPLYAAEAYASQANHDLPGLHGEADDEPLTRPNNPLQPGEVPPDEQTEAQTASFATSQFENEGDGDVPMEARLEEKSGEDPLNLSSYHAETAEALAHRLPEADKGEALPELVQRLEAGLVRRRRGRWMTPAGQATNGVAVAPGDHLDARLRGAIDELQKLASRGR